MYTRRPDYVKGKNSRGKEIKSTSKSAWAKDFSVDNFDFWWRVGVRAPWIRSPDPPPHPSLGRHTTSSVPGGAEGRGCFAAARDSSGP